MFSHDPPFAVNVVQEDGCMVLSLSGELDVATAPKLHVVISELVGPEVRAVSVNLARLTFIDLAGLRALVEAEQASTTAGATFRLSGVDGITRRAIQLTGHQVLVDAIRGQEGSRRAGWVDPWRAPAVSSRRSAGG